MSEFAKFQDAVDGLVGKLDGYKNDLNAEILKSKGELEQSLLTQKQELERLQQEVLDIKAAAGRMKEAGKKETFYEVLKGLIANSKQQLDDLAGMSKGFSIPVGSDFISKAVADMTISNNLTGNIKYTYRDGIIGIPYGSPHIRQIINVIPSATDSYHYYRHTGGEGVIDYQTEGANKSQFDEDVSEQVANLQALAGFVTITRQMLRNIPALQAYLNRWLPEKYLRAEDAKFATFMNANVGSMTVGVTTGPNIERIIKTMGVLGGLGFGVNGVMVNHASWSNIVTLKGATSGDYTLPPGVTVANDGSVRVFGVPLITAAYVPTDTAWVGQWDYVELIQSENVSVRFSEEHASNFVQNKITARVEATIAFTLLNPTAFSIIDLGDVV